MFIRYDEDLGRMTVTQSLREAHGFYSRWVLKHITLEERYASFVRRLEAARKRNGLA